MGRLAEAMESFQGALAIRKNKNDLELIKSTEQAISFLEKLDDRKFDA